MANFVLWLTATWPKLVAAVSAFGIFAIEPLARAYWPWLAGQIDRLSSVTKFRIEIAIVVLAFMYAAFSSWSEEHALHIKSATELINVTGERDEARRQRDEVRRQWDTELLTALGKLTVQPTQQPDFVETLKQSSPAKLREITDGFTSEVRLFQNEVTARSQSALLQYNELMSKASTEEQKQDIWRRGNEGSFREHNRIVAEFEARFRSKAIALREEIYRRRGLTARTPSGDHRTIPLDSGYLVGPRPLADMADYLDEIARQLR